MEKPNGDSKIPQGLKDTRNEKAFRSKKTTYKQTLITMAEKKVANILTYKIELTIFEDGTSSLSRTNDGFDVFRLLGILNLSTQEVISQMRGEVKPDIIKRKYIVD